MPIQNGIQLQRKLDEIQTKYNNGADPSALLDLIIILPEIKAIGGFARSTDEWRNAKRNYDLLWLRLEEQAERDNEGVLAMELEALRFRQPKSFYTRNF